MDDGNTRKLRHSIPHTYINPLLSANSISLPLIRTNKSSDQNAINDAKLNCLELEAIEQRIYKESVIPQALLGTFVLYLIIISSAYLFKIPDLPNFITEHNTKFVVCNDNNQYSAIQMNQQCIKNESLQIAIKLYQHLSRFLQDRAVQHYCIDKSQPEEISALDFMLHLRKRRIFMDMNELPQHILSVNYLIANNPFWKVHFSETNENTTEVQELVQYKLLDVRLPLSCILYRNLFFNIFCAFVVIALICSITYWKRRSTRINRHHLLLTHKFKIQILQSLAQNPWIIINELRDELIPLKERSTQLSSWNEALNYLNINDKRIEFGYVDFYGERFLTMVWKNNLYYRRSRSLVKGGRDTRCNNRMQILNEHAPRNTYSSSPFIKINNMFDESEAFNENLPTLIEEFIYSHVEDRTRISYIKLSRRRCCVFIRCATVADVNIVYNKMKGLRFRNNLISMRSINL